MTISWVYLIHIDNFLKLINKKWGYACRSISEVFGMDTYRIWVREQN